MNKSYNSIDVYLRLLKSAQPYWMFFLIGIIGTILAAGTDAMFTWSVKPIFDNWHAVLKHEKGWFNFLPLIIVGILLVRGLANFLSNYFLTCVGRNIVRDFRERIFNHLMHMPASYYDKESSGKLLATLIYNTEQVAGASTEALLTILQEGMQLLGLLAVMFSLSWQLTLIFMVTAPAISSIIRFSSKRLRALSGNVQHSMGELTHAAEEGIENYKVIRIFGGEAYEKQKFFTAVNNNRQREMKVVATSSIGTSLTQVVTALPIAIIIFVAIKFNISLGSFGAFIVATLGLLTPIRRLTKVNNEIQKGVAGAHSIFTLLDQACEHDHGSKTMQRSLGNIEYQDVGFSYPGAKHQVLSKINLKAESGKTIALVGRSGSGKTTLMSLLPRFYDITSGAILIDGINIKDYKLLDLRRQFSLVSQNLTLFNDTIANNIAYGALHDVTLDKITKAAEAAHILDFIQSLPDGFNTVVGENGVLLSGGQRQRLAIARALLKDAPFLILDEATSALDTESERHIQAALENLMKQRTTFVIAHRLSTIENADQILVLDKGKIIESGTHQQLLALQGKYAKLYNMQFSDK